MEKFDLLSFYKRMNEFKIILSFKGAFSQEVLVELGDVIKIKFGNPLNKKVKIFRRIFSIFIELSQNILKYSAERMTIDDEQEVGVGIIVLNEMNDCFKIISGNMIENDKIENLKKRCDLINSLSQEQLKDYFHKIRKEKHLQSESGANLGFIEIARKSTRPLIYSISPLDSQLSFLTLTISIPKG